MIWAIFREMTKSSFITDLSLTETHIQKNHYLEVEIVIYLDSGTLKKYIHTIIKFEKSYYLREYFQNHDLFVFYFRE